MHGAEGWQKRYGRELPISRRANFDEMPILGERPILTRCLGRADKPATVVAHSSDSRIKPEIPKLDLDLPPGNRGLVFGLHVLPGALVSFLQTGIVEKLSAGTVDVLNVALDDPDLLGKTGHRHGHRSRNQNSFQHTRDSLLSRISCAHH
jgi:hypothetical protein